MSRRNEILDAVISKFQEEGFSTDLTISQIANIVDIGKSTIYEYFKTKDDVFKEALLKISNENIEEVLNIENIEEMSFEDAFKAQFSKILDVSCRSRLIYQIFSKDFIHRMPVSIREELKQMMDETRKTIEQRFVLIFYKGINEKLVNIESDPESNLVISSLVVGAIIRYSNSNQEVKLENFVDKIYDTVLKLGN